MSNSYTMYCGDTSHVTIVHSSQNDVSSQMLAQMYATGGINPAAGVDHIKSLRTPWSERKRR